MDVYLCTCVPYLRVCVYLGTHGTRYQWDALVIPRAICGQARPPSGFLHLNSLLSPSRPGLDVKLHPGTLLLELYEGLPEGKRCWECYPGC